MIKENYKCYRKSINISDRRRALQLRGKDRKNLFIGELITVLELTTKKLYLRI